MRSAICIHGRQPSICAICVPILEAVHVRQTKRTSNELASLAEATDAIWQRVLRSTMGDVPGRTADVKQVALLRLRQAADTLAEEAVVLERTGE